MRKILAAVFIMAFVSGCAGSAGMQSKTETAAIDALVAPGKIHEACYEMLKGQVLRYRFTASKPLDFNIHFHEGAHISYPVELNGVAAQNGDYVIPQDQFYCLMWTNKQAEPVTLGGSVVLLRSPQ
ncbi:MAG TPA: hypothetical protein VK445_06990 [Dissulfurispiraceae bacterium]|nr:hypothetical protein [Dissulfurispiraceae bacterium]